MEKHVLSLNPSHKNALFNRFLMDIHLIIDEIYILNYF